MGALTDKIVIQKQNDNGDVIMEMSSYPMFDLFKVGVTHFSVFGSFVQCSFNESLCNALHKQGSIRYAMKVYPMATSPITITNTTFYFILFYFFSKKKFYLGQSCQ